MRNDERTDGGPSDEELVDRARRGDEAALAALVDRHHAAAYRVAVSMLRDDDGAQDIVQDAFIRAFRGLPGFRGDAAFRTWLLTITANEARAAIRRRGRRRETGFEDAGSVPLDQVGADERLAILDEADRVRAVLATLPEKQRLSVSLRIEEGLSFREIGEVIGSSEGAARVNYFHGIRRLREMMS